MKCTTSRIRKHRGSQNLSAGVKGKKFFLAFRYCWFCR